ncbi:MAG: NUDIX domain-containing protein [Planctomycetota bacterium]
MGSNQQHLEIEVIARALILDEGRVLLCRSVRGGYTYLPGGHVEPGEPAVAAAARELKEEAGLRAVMGRGALITEEHFEVSTNRGSERHHELNFVFHVEQVFGPDGGEAIRAGDPVASRESHIEFVWADLASLHDLDLRPASIRAWLMSGGASSDLPAVPVVLTGGAGAGAI